MDSDETLLLQFQTGSHAALEELFARYRDGIYGFFCRRLKNVSRAEDLTQETFLAVIRGIVRYEPRASVRTYLYGIAFRVLFTELRKQMNSHPAIADEEQWVDSAPDVTLWVREALQRLDNSDREILMLREYEQLSYDEIAAVLRLPLNTVRSRLFRSRMALKQHLEPQKHKDVVDRGETCK
ncbi:MAG: sigma-70 family RNA polymerase sigma factor [Acidobacteriaceae bacterium]|nr:sigma-70 family RNA polymerase sigma factor [Acidobacteriaceae bacterium]MBV9679607.1 sigma-70 family RNA polymerase sigma factor [Acidobacteriaceae bacterium]